MLSNLVFDAWIPYKYAMAGVFRAVIGCLVLVARYIDGYEFGVNVVGVFGRIRKSPVCQTNRGKGIMGGKR